jgi:exosortase/archaeosortase family protein
MPEAKKAPNPFHYLGIAFGLIVVFVVGASVTGTQQARLDYFTTDVFVKWINIFGLDAFSDGRHATATIRGQRVGFHIEYGCNGLLMYLLLTATMLPFPCAWKRRVPGLILGLIFAFIANQIRLFGLLVVLTFVKDPEEFDIYHTGIGQAYSIITVLIYWQLWLTWQRRCMRSPPPGDAPVAATDSAPTPS